MKDLEILSELETVVGNGAILTGDEVHSRAAAWDRDGGCNALAIVRPRTTLEVSQVLSICNRAGQAVVPHGGLTGVVDGNLARPNEIAISLERMNQIEEMDEAGMTMTVQAGVVLQTVQERADSVGLMFPLDLGARGSAMIGGLVSTNAGGNRVIRYGMTRNLVLGLEAVLADGTIISALNRVIKNNAGYDLKHLFIGSEGTLGVVTRAVLRLMPRARSQHTALVGVAEFASLPILLRDVSSGFGGALSAFEMMEDDFFTLVTSPPAKNKSPLSREYPYYVLVDMLGAGQPGDDDRFESTLVKSLSTGVVEDCVIAKTGKEREALWAIRDDVEQVLRYRPVFTFDVSLAIREMEDYVADVKRRLSERWASHHCFVFGHLGDGNLHLVISVGAGDSETRKRVEEIIYGELRERGGSVSAEHGIGLEKRAYLSWCRSEEEIALMRTLKQALDPKGILNPGKIFEAANNGK